ncbi:MAG TPA: choice-of-anchor D domain-containing protein [Candidatus Acidoferrum sp.]|nr:choice-of-anchor D domain-containing protein [Candidatus Acidoferrum sp.]
MTRNDQTGVLTPVSGSPFAPAVFQTLDVQGRFLFGPGTNAIHMYQVNSTTGVYSEVPNSPFASPNTNQPVFIAVEPSGKYLAVVNQVGLNPGESSIETFQIDAANLALVPVLGSLLELDSTLIGAEADPKNRRFYVFLAPNPSNPLLQLNSELNDYAIDPLTGFVSGNIFTVGTIGHCLAIDPQARFLVIGMGRIAGIIGVLPIAAATGIPSSALATTSLGLGVFPTAVSTEVTGNFIYLTDTGTSPGPVHIYALDSQTLTVAETSSSPLPGFTSVPGLMGDPTGPFMYGLVGTSVQAYMTDPQTGYFTPVSGTFISAPGVNGNFVFSIPPGQQNLVGPVATLTPSSLSLGNILVGTPSQAQSITLTSTGDQGLSLSSISIAGANANEFSESDNCQAPTVLQPSKFCIISVIFTPSATGQRQATLALLDNAPGSPQSVPLNGMGVVPPPPNPLVTLIPGSISFPTITQGMKGTPSTVTVTNSGNATLHIASVVVGGNNPNDFASTINCSGAISANASCTITVTFAPLAAGQRTETITLTDDAPNSPQIVNVGGNANPAFSGGPAPNGSTTASVSAGQTAQYLLQLNPGAGYSGTVSLTCSGAPLNAACQVPASVSIANGAPAPFTVTVLTRGGAVLPPSIPWRLVPPAGIRVLLLLALAWVLVKAGKNRWMFDSTLRERRLAWSGALAAVFLCSVIFAAGCGSSSVTTTPPPVVTPPGSSTITITPTAMSTSGMPLQLQPIQLTLTVK